MKYWKWTTRSTFRTRRWHFSTAATCATKRRQDQAATLQSRSFPYSLVGEKLEIQKFQNRIYLTPPRSKFPKCLTVWKHGIASSRDSFFSSSIELDLFLKLDHLPLSWIWNTIMWFSFSPFPLPLSLTRSISLSFPPSLSLSPSLIFHMAVTADLRPSILVLAINSRSSHHQLCWHTTVRVRG